jgi:short-subunit dehydrogenase
MDVQRAIARPGLRCACVAADLTTPAGRDAVASAAMRTGVDLLINNAGISAFAWFADQSEEEVGRILEVNALAPMLLTRRLLPLLQSQPAATIVNVGSIFGYLGYPGCASYSASKFALRGFTEALRRELADGFVRVLYFAPRATRTALNSDALTALNEELGVAMDAPAAVADELMRLLRRPARERLLGMPEKLFARINQLLPGLVDNGLRKQLSVIRDYARGRPTRPARPATPIRSSEGGPL